MSRYVIAGLLFIYTQVGTSKTIWHLSQVKDKPVPVHLKMGKVSVIRLHERPRNIMLGNPAFFDVQVYGQDIAIRPKGFLISNMLVYGKHDLLNFKLLSHEQSPFFDDIVLIQSQKRSTQTFKIASRSLGKGLKIEFIRLRYVPKKGQYILDFKLKNIKSRTVHSKKLKVKFKRMGKVLKLRHYLSISKGVIKKGQTSTGRLTFYYPSKQSLSLNFSYKSKYSSIIINRRSL